MEEVTTWFDVSMKEMKTAQEKFKELAVEIKELEDNNSLLESEREWIRPPGFEFDMTIETLEDITRAEWWHEKGIVWWFGVAESYLQWKNRLLEHDYEGACNEYESIQMAMAMIESDIKAIKYDKKIKSEEINRQAISIVDKNSHREGMQIYIQKEYNLLVAEKIEVGKVAGELISQKMSELIVLRESELDDQVSISYLKNVMRVGESLIAVVQRLLHEPEYPIFTSEMLKFIGRLCY